MNTKAAKQILPTSNETISLLELKLLVTSIIHEKASIRMKFQMDDGAWTSQFLSIMMVTGRGLVLNDDTSNKIQSIQFIEDVVQFVLERPFDNYNSKIAYTVH